MTKVPRWPGSGPSNAFAEFDVAESDVLAGARSSGTLLPAQELAQVDLTVIVTADQIADHTQDEREEEPEETPDRRGDTKQEAGQKTDGGSCHVSLLG